jgi:predicted Zn-dependent protease
MHRTRRILLAGLIALPALAATSGCGMLISPEQEIAMGEQAAPEFEKEFGGRVEDAALQQYVSDVGMSVAAKCDRELPYEYLLVRSKDVNAFALPGGKIFLTAGLMARMTNERQVAAVLGHETGHCCARHNVKAMERQLGVALAAEIAARVFSDSPLPAGDITKIVGAVANLKYSRDDEYEADQRGIEYMSQAGYNPYGMVELLTVLKDLSEREPGTLEEMFSTHPLPANRIDKAREAIEDDHESAAPDAADPHRDRFLQMRARLRNAVPGLPAGD